MQVLNAAAAGDTLQMNSGYFFRLLEHMTAGRSVGASVIGTT